MMFFQRCQLGFCETKNATTSKNKSSRAALLFGKNDVILYIYSNPAAVVLSYQQTFIQMFR